MPEPGPARRPQQLPARVLAFVVGLVPMTFYGIMRYQTGAGVIGFWRWNVDFHFPWLPGRTIHFPFVPFLLICLGLVAAVVLLSRTGRSVVFGLFRLGTGRMLFAIGLLAFTLLPLGYPGLQYVDPGYWVITTMLFGTSGFVLIAWSVYPLLRRLGPGLLACWHRLERMPRGRFLLLCGAFTLALAVVVNFVVLENLPHINDAIAQLFHARIFATGRLFAQSPSLPAFFDFTQVISNGRWYSQYPFGHVLMLAIGVLLRVPWLINPLQGALTVVLVYFIARRLFSRRTARVAALLATLSPFLWFMSGAYMNHTTALMFCALFLALFLGIPDSRRWPLVALLAGLALGMAAATRPGTALAYGLPFALYGLVMAVRSPRLFPRYAVALAGVGVMMVLLLLYNQATNGHPLLFGYEVLHGPRHGFAFGRVAFGMTHTPWKGLVHLVNNLNGLNRYLFELPFPGFALFALLVGAGSARGRDWLLLAPLAVLLVLHFFYFWHGFGYGPRFVFETLPGLVIVSARALVELPAVVRRAGAAARGLRPSRVLAGTAAIGLFALLVAWPLSIVPQARSYVGFCAASGKIKRLARRLNLNNALVFSRNPHNTFILNRLDLQGPVVYANDGGTANALLALEYPGRGCWYADDDTIVPLFGVEETARPLVDDLQDAFDFAAGSLTPRHRCIIWPLPVPRHLPASAATVTSDRLIAVRDANNRVHRNQARVADFLPALNVRIPGDRRPTWSLEPFQYQDSAISYIVDSFRFRLAYESPNGLCLVYDIDTVDPDEVLEHTLPAGAAPAAPSAETPPVRPPAKAPPAAEEDELPAGIKVPFK